MKTLRTFLAWPIIFIAAWYFFGFEIAAVVGLVYLHLMTILLFYVTEAHKEKLVQIVEHIAKKDGLIDAKNINFNEILTAKDMVAALGKMKK